MSFWTPQVIAAGVQNLSRFRQGTLLGFYLIARAIGAAILFHSPSSSFFMPNTTLNYLLANRPVNLMGFSGAVTTSSVHLPGPGGQSGTGFALPRRGFLTGLTVYDGTTTRSETDSISFAENDKLSLFCQSNGSNFTVKVRLNGTSTALEVASVPHNSTLFAVVEFVLIRE